MFSSLLYVNIEEAKIWPSNSTAADGNFQFQ